MLRSRRRFSAAVAVLWSLFLLPSGSRPQTAQVPGAVHGQSATLLPDGRLLLLGGEGPNGLPLSGGIVFEPATGRSMPLVDQLQHARAGHSATVLPDGTILIVGGVGSAGRVVAHAELLNLATQTFEVLPAGPAPRAYHTATLLTDGHVLIVGGIAEDGTLETAGALWNPGSRGSETVLDGFVAPRLGHTAALLPDGSVLISGGVDGNGARVAAGEVYDPVGQRFAPVQRLPQTPATLGYASAVLTSEPADGSTGVSVSSVIALRFSSPMRVETVNSQTVILSGPQGPEAVLVTPAEAGMLTFVTPQRPLLPSTAYTLTLSGSSDSLGLSLPFTVIRFTTQRTSPDTVKGTPTSNSGSATTTSRLERNDRSAQPGDVDDEWEWKGERRDGRPHSRWQSLPPLEAAPGMTALAGQVLRLNGEPLPGVTLQMASDSGPTAHAHTDETGRFLLEGIKLGHQELVIDGRGASTQGRTYGVFEVGVKVAAGKTTALGYTIWMPRIDTAHAVTLPTYTTAEMVVTTPRIPRLELHLPPHSSVRDHEGKPANQISITPIPPDRPPFPLPDNVDTPAYFTIQPGAGYVYSRDGSGARIVYPNHSGAKRTLAGTRFQFWSYDPGAKGWHVYGLGTVLEGAEQVTPDPKVEIYEFTGAMAEPLPVPESPALYAVFSADPVDLATGIFVMRKTDLVLPDIVPIVLARTYRPGDTAQRAFGLGGNHPYDIFIRGNINPYTYMDVILPDGAKIHFDRISAGSEWFNAIYEHSSSPTRFYKSRITWNEGHLGWDLTFKDGTVYQFHESSGAPRSQWASLKGVRDRYGNSLALTRDSARNLTRITTPSGRWVDFTYDAGYRITQARDNIGRTVTYTYDGTGRLDTVTDPAGWVTTYTYDASNRLFTIKDARNIVYLTNEYDTSGRVIRQTQPGGIVWQIAYTPGAGGVTTIEVTDPRGNVRRVTFNADKYPLTDVQPVGLPEQQTTTYEWQAVTNLLQAVVDPLGRRTAYGYDTMGNLTSLTRMAGTAEAVSTTLSYEPTFNRVASITDPLNQTTTFGYDAAGHLTTITDPLLHQTTFGNYTALGQPQTITTPAGATQIAYEAGDLTSIIDPVGRVTRRFTDTAGRAAAVTDPRGNQTRYEYDSLNRLTKITDALGGQTQFGYDPNGNLLTLTDARSNTTSYTYDSMDRVATRTDPLNRSETYQYDLDGNLTQVTDRRGKTTTFSYDGLNRRTFAGFAQTAPSTYESTISYGFDAGNRLRTFTDSLAGTLTLNYDNLDRLTQEVSPQGTVGYLYDPAGRRTRLAVPGQADVVYTYDNADRLTQLARGSATVLFEYDNADRRTKLTLPNGVTVDYAWDPASQLLGLTYKKGLATLAALTYDYDLTRNRTKVEGGWARTGLPDPLGSADYNLANHQLALGGRTMEYDAAGNLTKLTEPSGITTFSWDARGQLTGMSTPDGPASFLYDGLGRRRAKIVGGVRTDYLYDGLTPVQETQGATSVTLLTGLGIDEYFTRSTTAGTRTYLTDALGSTVALTDDTGAVQSEYTYEPFGATTETGADSNPFQYTGRENDLMGFYYYRARYYHPALQRFISEDPVGFAGGDTNLFSYVVNNPINLYDPLGLWGLGVVGGGSAALGGGPVLPSAGLVAASGGGLFFGGPQGVNVGGFTSLGGFANLGAAGHPGSNFAFGGFAGLGGGAFLTNANSAADLAKTTHTASLDVGIGIIKGSIQLSYGGGVWSLSGTVGPGIGLSLSNLEATTRGSGQPTPSTALSSPDPFSSVSQGGPPRLGLSGRK